MKGIVLAGGSGTLRSACSLLESSMPPSLPVSLCASLVEGLSALELAASVERAWHRRA